MGCGVGVGNYLTYPPQVKPHLLETYPNELFPVKLRNLCQVKKQARYSVKYVE